MLRNKKENCQKIDTSMDEFSRRLKIARYNFSKRYDGSYSA